MRIFLTLFLLFIVSFSFYLGAYTVQSEVMKNAVSAFAMAKGLNAIISVVQGTEFSAAPLGLGLSISIGEVLDPFNDMVERFSLVMLASIVSLGVQELLLELSSKMFLQVALALSGVMALVFIWSQNMRKNIFFVLTIKIFFLVLILRFGALFFSISSEYFYHTMQESKYEVYMSDINVTKNKLDAIKEESKSVKNIQVKEDNVDEGILSGISDYFDEKINNLKFSLPELNVSKKLELLEKDIQSASNNIIHLMTMFIIQTILFPLLFLWFFTFLVKLIFNIKINYDILQK
ncbi:MAG: hypothetical protein Q9M32_03895 [Sulfurimonas sp.]|nr:hypothetical protein [Sulfurimonas sp.]MDQ7061144.1 hypothetical protein [Sulfurimonas sp.]